MAKTRSAKFCPWWVLSCSQPSEPEVPRRWQLSGQITKSPISGPAVPIKPIKSPPAALQLYPPRLQLPQLLCFAAILLHKEPDAYTVPELIGCFVSEDIAIEWVHCAQNVQLLSALEVLCPLCTVSR